MARAKLEFEGFSEIAQRYIEYGANLRKGTEQALVATHEYVTANIEQVFTPSNMPAKGKYWTGSTLEKLRRQATVEWNGDVASVPVGFEIKEAGINSIFLMYGTPRHKPPMKAARGLYDAIYGKKTIENVRDIQEEVLYRGLENL